MVILYASGDIVFAYKDINWPIPSIGTRKRGFIGIRPHLRDGDYSTRGNYVSTNHNAWYVYSWPLTKGFQYTWELCFLRRYYYYLWTFFAASGLCIFFCGTFRSDAYRNLCCTLLCFTRWYWLSTLLMYSGHKYHFIVQLPFYRVCPRQSYPLRVWLEHYFTYEVGEADLFDR